MYYPRCSPLDTEIKFVTNSCNYGNDSNLEYSMRYFNTQKTLRLTSYLRELRL